MEQKRLTAKFGLRVRLQGRDIRIPRGFTCILAGTHFEYEGVLVPYAMVRHAVKLEPVQDEPEIVTAPAEEQSTPEPSNEAQAAPLPNEAANEPQPEPQEQPTEAPQDAKPEPQEQPQEQPAEAPQDAQPEPQRRGRRG